MIAKVVLIGATDVGDRVIDMQDPNIIEFGLVLEFDSPESLRAAMEKGSVDFQRWSELNE